MKRLGKIILILLLSLLGVVIFAVVGVTAYFYIVGSVDATVPIVDDRDLRLPFDPIPDEENAFIVFASASDHYAVASDNYTETCSSDYFFVTGYSERFSENTSSRKAREEPQAESRADAILAKHTPLFALLAEGVQRKAYRTIPAMDTLSNFASAEIIAQFMSYGALLGLKAQRELERGELESATQTIELLHAFSEKMLVHTDAHITSTVGDILKRKAYQKMIDVVGMGLLTDEMRNRFQACLDADTQTAQANYERTVRAEYTVISAKLAQLYLDKAYTSYAECLNPLQRLLFRWPGYLRFAFQPRASRAMFADVARQALQGKVQKVPDEEPSLLTPNYISKQVMLDLIGAAGGMLSDAKKDAFNRAKVRILLAASKWKQHNNDAFPPSLDALVPTFLSAVPVDPWSADARPLAYHPETGTVWSVGEEGDFDYLACLNAPISKRFGDSRYKFIWNAFRLDGKPHPLLSNNHRIPRSVEE